MIKYPKPNMLENLSNLLKLSPKSFTHFIFTYSCYTFFFCCYVKDEFIDGELLELFNEFDWDPLLWDDVLFEVKLVVRLFKELFEDGDGLIMYNLLIRMLSIMGPNILILAT